MMTIRILSLLMTLALLSVTCAPKNKVVPEPKPKPVIVPPPTNLALSLPALELTGAYGSSAKALIQVEVLKVNGGEEYLTGGICWSGETTTPDTTCARTQSTLRGSSYFEKTGTLSGTLQSSFLTPGTTQHFRLYIITDKQVYYSPVQSISVPDILTDNNVTRRIPVIFHILHNTPSQNIRAEYIQSYLKFANLTLRNRLTPGANPGVAIDTHIELYATDRGPQGKRLVEPGINRVAWEKASTDQVDFLDNISPSDEDLVWDPYRYVNVWLFDFPEQAGNISGTTVTPFMPSSHPIDGLITSDYAASHAIHYKPGIALNTRFFSVTETFVHEFGHLIGLLHIFSRNGCGDDDYCNDTPNYDLDNYMATGSMGLNDRRTACDGSQFVSYNMMDYFGMGSQVTGDQNTRMAYVFEHGYYVPRSSSAMRTRSNTIIDNHKPQPRMISTPLKRVVPKAMFTNQADK